MTVPSVLLLATCVASVACSSCHEPSPAFPVPQWEKKHGPWISQAVFGGINRLLATIDKSLLESSSYSVEVTSGDETLWTNHHTAQQRNEQRPGVMHVDGDSQFRIASVTKAFTALGLLYQHAAGNLSLDDPVDGYIAELRDDGGAIRWNGITLRSLASQLSGIPRDFSSGFIRESLPDPTAIGLPPSFGNRTLPCPDAANNGSCTGADLLRALKQRNPVFAPDTKPTYSNDAFSLLGLVLEQVTGITYSEYMAKAIFEPLGMSSTSFEKPPDDQAVLPVESHIWDWEEGVERPTGGLYACSRDMSRFLRFVLKNYNSIATGENWLSPASWGTGMSNFYGMPWEIFRSDKILENTRRPVTFYTKSGGLPGYYSLIVLLPEYNLGVTFLVAGEHKILGNLRDLLLPALVKAAESAIWEYVADQYTGKMVATEPSLNSFLTFASSPKDGLTITDFISNGTDVLNFVIPQFLTPNLGQQGIRWHAQLIPTMLFKEDESSQQGEIWRMLIAESRTENSSVFDEWCVSDIDSVTYKGIPINEVVFWREERLVEFPAFEVVFKPDVDEMTASSRLVPGYIEQLQRLLKPGL